MQIEQGSKPRIRAQGLPELAATEAPGAVRRGARARRLCLDCRQPRVTQRRQPAVVRLRPDKVICCVKGRPRFLAACNAEQRKQPSVSACCRRPTLDCEAGAVACLRSLSRRAASGAAAAHGVRLVPQRPRRRALLHDLRRMARATTGQACLRSLAPDVQCCDTMMSVRRTELAAYHKVGACSGVARCGSRTHPRVRKALDGGAQPDEVVAGARQVGGGLIVVRRVHRRAGEQRVVAHSLLQPPDTPLLHQLLLRRQHGAFAKLQRQS